jgi:hypothetical protein
VKRRLAVVVATIAMATGGALAVPGHAQTGTQKQVKYSCSHQVRGLVVPEGWTMATIRLAGAQGNHANGGDSSGGAGLGGKVEATVPVKEGDYLRIVVGCQDGWGDGSNGSGGHRALGKAGNSQDSDPGGYDGATGGGASFVTGPGWEVTGGGGGGAGGGDGGEGIGGTGGHGGRSAGAGSYGCCYAGPGGGGANQGGRRGGDAPNYERDNYGLYDYGGGGSGGGGCNGGGGGDNQPENPADAEPGAGGGGGSSCTSGSATDVEFIDSHQHGNGYVIITFFDPQAGTPSEDTVDTTSTSTTSTTSAGQTTTTSGPGTTTTGATTPTTAAPVTTTTRGPSVPTSSPPPPNDSTIARFDGAPPIGSALVNLERSTVVGGGS